MLYAEWWPLLLHCHLFFTASFHTSQLHILYFNIISESYHKYRQNVHSYTNVSIFLLLFFCNTQVSEGHGLLALTWSRLLLACKSDSLCGMSAFFTCLILHSGHCGVIHPCFVLLWFNAEGFFICYSFAIATDSTMPIISSVAHMGHKACYGSVLCQCPRNWPMSLFWLLQAGFKGTVQLLLACAYCASYSM